MVSMKNIKVLIKNIMAAFLATFAVFNVCGLESGNILLGVVFLAAFYFAGHIRKNSKKEGVIAICLALIYTASYAIYVRETIAGGLENKLFAAVYVTFTILGLYIIFYMAILKILQFFEKTSYTEGRPDVQNPWKIWAIYTLILFVCMLPLLILNYPGTMTVDSFNQLEQVWGTRAYNDHHPWVHTMIIKFWYDIGYGISGDVYIGIATYTVFQMIAVAASVAYAIASLNRAGAGRMCRILVALGCILYPYNAAYSITMWKDVLFAACVLAFTVALYIVVCVKANSKAAIGDYIVMTISGIGMCLLRHNGLYAYIGTALVCLVAGLIAAHKNTEKNGCNIRVLITGAIIFAATIITVCIVRGPITRANNVIEGEYVYNVCVPLQQIARVVSDGKEIAQEDRDWLERINTIEYIENNYLPHGADNMFCWVLYGDKDYFYSHKGEFFSLWMRLGLKYPKEYMEAFFDQTQGYYTTMAPEQVAYYGILPNEDNLEPRPLIAGPLQIKCNELMDKIYTMFPVYGIMYSMGAVFLLCLLGIGICVVRNDYRKIFIFAPVILLIGTVVIATPLVADLRYAFPLMLTMPSLIAMCLHNLRVENTDRI